MADAAVDVIRPQEGYQMKALSSPADIVIGGAAAGVGKTFTLLLDPLHFVDVPGFGGIIFRRTYPQIRNEGGLWDTSVSLYPRIGATPRENSLEWVFPEGPKVKFSHLQYEKNIYDYQGSQIPFIGFDELTHFTKKMFFYMLSRNRSVCGVKPYVRATCNPDPDSWVSEFIAWWIDQETGYPIPERNGVLRYLVIDGEDYIWGDTPEEAIEKAWYILQPIVERSGIAPQEFVKSVTFISGSIYENKELLKVNPAYIGNLLSQDKETKAALLDGNWKVVLSEADIYDYPSYLGMFNNLFEVTTGTRFITADIALKGSDKFVVLVWDGKEVIDCLIMDKSNGKEVVDGIKSLAKQYQIQNKHIVFDNDGVGGFVDGFIVGAVEFKNGSSPINKENYEHLKAQCYYKSGDAVANGGYRISEEVANRMYDDKMTIRQRFMFERKAIKRAKKDKDGPMRIIKKDEMKAKLNGESPDLMDAFMMREWFDLKPTAAPIQQRMKSAKRR